MQRHGRLKASRVILAVLVSVFMVFSGIPINALDAVAEEMGITARGPVVSDAQMGEAQSEGTKPKSSPKGGDPAPSDPAPSDPAPADPAPADPAPPASADLGDLGTEQLTAAQPGPDQPDVSVEKQSTPPAVDMSGVQSENTSQNDPSAKTEDKLQSDARNLRSTFTYEDDAVKVTATLIDPTVLPKGVRLQVTEVTQGGKDYNYDAYMQALNASANKSDAYSDKNTLLYDVAFLATDESGKTIEVQPSKDSVRVSFEFKRNQLADQLDAKRAADVDVTHLPLVDSAKRATDTTAQATGISKDDVVVESLPDADVNANGTSNISMKVDGFSVYAFSYTVDFTYGDYTYSIAGESNVKLSKLFQTLGINANAAHVKNVTFSNSDLVKVEQQGEDWLLTSLKPFTSNETLTVEMASGAKYVVAVTDAQNDITQLQSEVTISDGVNSNVTKVYAGQEYEVGVKFAEEQGGVQFPTDSPFTMTYQMPKGFVVKNGQRTGTTTMPITGTTDVINLDYSIDENNLITFTWRETDSEKYHDFQNKVYDGWFRLHLDGTFKEDATGDDLVFKGKTNTTVTLADPSEVSVALQSKSASYNTGSNQMEYTVTVKSTGYNPEVVVTDALKDTSYLKYVTGSVRVKVGNDEITTSVSNESSTGFTATIPSLGNDRVATITYKADVDLNALINAGYTNDKTITKDSTPVSHSAIENAASVTSAKDSSPDTKTWPSEWEGIKFNYTSISKSNGGASDVSDGKRTTTWTVAYNSEQLVSMSGETVTDQITSNLGDIAKYSSDVTLKVYSGDVQVGADRIIEIPNKDQAASWSYVIPAEDSAAYKYVFTYTTEADVSEILTPTTIGNKVSYDGTKGKGEAVSGVPVSPGDNAVSVSKQAKSVDVSTGKIVWDIKLNVPDSALDSVVISDDLPTSKDWYSEEYRDVLFDSVGKSVEVTEGLQGTESYVATVTDKGFTVTFYKDAEHNTAGLDKAGKRTINIQVATKISEDWIEASKTGDDYKRNHENTGKATINGDIILDFSADTYVDPTPTTITKSVKDLGTIWLDGKQLKCYEYKVVLTGVNAASFVDDKLVLNDTFDSKYLVLCEDNNHKARFAGSTSETGAWENDDYSSALTTEKEGSSSVKFTVDNTGDALTKEGRYSKSYVLTYYMRVKDEATQAAMDELAKKSEGGAVKLTNTVAWPDKNMESSAEASYSVPISKKEDLGGGLDSATNTYRVKFRITINESKAIMGSSKYITAKDSYTNLAIDYATINVVECEPASAKDDITWDGSGNAITYRVPNGTKAVIEYTSVVNEPGKYTNTLDVEGQVVSKENNAYWNIGGSSEGGGSLYSMRILKHEAGSLTKTLGGVEFRVYRLVKDKASYTKKSDDYEDADGNVWEYWKTVTTSTASDATNGIATIDNTGGWLNMTDKFLVKEQPNATDATNGPYVSVNDVHYKLDTTDWTFRIGEKADYGVTTAGEYIYTNNDVLKIRNVPLGDQTLSVNTRKVWVDDNDSEKIRPSKITVNLIQDTGTEEKIYDDASTSGVVEGTVELSESNNWTYEWAGLPYGYTYVVEEQPVDGYTATYENNGVKAANAPTVEIINTKNAYTKIDVEKVWKNQNGTVVDAPEGIDSVSLSLTRQKKLAPKSVVVGSKSVPMQGAMDNGTHVWAKYTGDNSGSGELKLLSGGNRIGGSYYVEVKPGSKIDCGEVSGYDPAKELSFTSSITSVSAEDFTFSTDLSEDYIDDSSFSSKQYELTAIGGWKTTIDKLDLTDPFASYRYVLKENALASDKSITTTYIVDGNPVGSDSIDTSYLMGTPSHKVVVTNTYKTEEEVPSPISSDLLAKKNVSVTDGRGDSKTLANGQFAFKAELTSNNADGVDNTSFVAEPSNTADGNVNFGTISFVKPGTYTYAVTETSPSGNGYTKDSSIYTVTYVLDADMHVTKTIRKGDEDVTSRGITFENTYAANPITVSFSGSKKLKKGNADQNMKANQFGFTITSTASVNDGADESKLNTTVGNDDTGALDFGSVTYSKPGTWTYTVKENAVSSATGVLGDNTIHTVTVTVTDNDAGQLEAKVKVDGGVESAASSANVTASGLDFTNTILSGTATLSVKKQVKGNADYKTDEKFAFKLEAESATDGDGEAIAQANIPMPSGEGNTVEATAGANNAAGEAASFGAISYERTGTYYYKITEQVPDPNQRTVGMTYNVNSYWAKVTVEPDGNLAATLKTTVKYAASKEALVNEATAGALVSDDLVVSNAFAKVTYQPQIAKQVSGMGAPSETYSFTLTDKSADKSGEVFVAEEQKPYAASVTGAGVASFPAITYTKAGTYTYEMAETEGATSGMAYSKGKVLLTVDVAADTKTGALTATANYSGGDDTTAATKNVLINTYTAPTPTPAAIEKYVNKDVHANLAAFDSTFTYDILAYVTEDANKVVITDELTENVLYSNGANTSVSVVDLGTTDNHNPGAEGTVSTTGTAIATATHAIDGQTLTVTIPEAKTEALNLRGHWVKVTFDAKLNNANGKVSTWNEYTNKEGDQLTNNTPVNTATAHKGICNSASYVVYKSGDEEGKPTYSKESNIVTVTPGTTNISVAKQWKDGDGTTSLSWPAGTTVTVKLLKTTGTGSSATTVETGDTLALTSSESATFSNLPVYEGVTYGVAEASVSGVSASDYATTVTGDVTNGFTITNTKISTTSVSGKKIWADNNNEANKRTGVTIKLQRKVAGGDWSDVQGKTVTIAANATGDDLKYSFADLPQYDGSSKIEYRVIETGVPEGYTATGGTESDGYDITNTIKGKEERELPVTLKVHKTGAQSASLKDATFTLTDSKGQTKNYVTGEDGTATITFQEPGEWTLKETNAPAGYTVNSAVYDISVSRDGTPTITYDQSNAIWTWAYNLIFGSPQLGEGNVLEVKDSLTKVKVSKVDVAGQKELAGATIQVLDAEGNVAKDAQGNNVEWVSTTEPHEVEGLATGVTYTLRETVAPTGYAITTDTTFQIDEHGKVTSTGATTTDGNGVTVLLVEDAKAANANISLKKEVTSNVPWETTEEFEFTLARGADGQTGDTINVATAKAKSGENAAFDVTFSKAGTYYYTITETPGKTENLTYDTAAKWAKVVVSGGSGADYKVDSIRYGASKAEVDSDQALDKLVVYNVYTVPALEKYINKDVHQDLPAYDTPFTYDIMAYVTKDADRVVITDSLAAKNGIRFLKGANTRVTVQEVGETNDHQAHGTVEQAKGRDIEATTKIDGKNLTIEIDNKNNVQRLRGKWVRVTYDVVLDNAIVGDESGYVANDDDVERNGTVTSNEYPNGTKEEPSHDGVATTASYVVYAQGADGKEVTYSLNANTITVTPPTVSIEVAKQWKDASGATVAWPKDAKVTIELIRAGEKTGNTVTLDAEHTSGSFDGMPVYENIDFKVDETSVQGVTRGFTTAVSGDRESGFVLTNTFVSEQAVRVRISKVDVADDKELKGAHLQILDKDGNVVTEWVSDGGVHEVEGLQVGQTYTLRETVAPDGYDVATDIEFTINNDGSVTTAGKTTTDANGNVVLLVEDAKKGTTTTKNANNGANDETASRNNNTPNGSTTRDATTSSNGGGSGGSVSTRTTNGSSLAKTGDPTTIGGLMMLAVGGVGVGIAGVATKIRRRRK